MRGWWGSAYRGCCRNWRSSRATRHTCCWPASAPSMRGSCTGSFAVDPSPLQIVQRAALSACSERRRGDLLEEYLVATLHIRPDIREQYPSLFGTKTVNGRTVDVEKLIADMTASVRDELHELLAERHAYQERIGNKTARYSFLPPGEEISDADGNKTTVAAIRKGMLDGFFGRKTPDAWRLNPTVPIPPDTMRPGLEGTGPAIDLGMAMGALNTEAASWMWDWEDAGGDFKDQLYRAWVNLSDILEHKWDGKPFVHPTKKRSYTIDAQIGRAHV